jgi:hypothetical protein
MPDITRLLRAVRMPSSRSRVVLLACGPLLLLAGCPEPAPDDAASGSGTAGDASASAGTVGDDGGPSDASATATATAATSAGDTDADDASTTAANDGTTGSDDTDTAGTDTGGSGSGSESGGEPLSDDPFDPAACNGVAWTAGDAAAQLGGMPRQVLTSATIQVRTRQCNGEVCDPWSGNADWWIHYLTWSGGVVTAYKDFLADMNLVLYDDDGTPRLSMQHVTFVVGGYPDDDGVVYDFPPQPVNYPHLRAFDDAPDSRYYYTDLDYQVSEGVLVIGDGCAVWTANPFGAGLPHTQQYGAVFHW